MQVTRRRFLVSAAQPALMLALGGPALAAAGRQGCGAAAWPAIKPPLAPRVSHPIEQLGRRREDPYAWMKYIPEQGSRELEQLPPMLRSHLQAEIAYAGAMLSDLDAERDLLLERMMQRAGKAGAAPPLTVDGWQYFSSVPEGGIHKAHVRLRPGGPDEILVDEAARAQGQAYYRSTDHQPSPDHRYFAWAEDVIGNDRHRIQIRDTRTGTTRTIVPADAYGYGGLIFSPSSEWLFWIWRDARNRPTRLYRTPVAGGTSELVYEERDPAIFMQVRRTGADGFVALVLSGPDTTEVRLIPANAETVEPKLVFARRNDVRYDIEEWNERLLLVTDADGAVDKKILSLAPDSFKPIETLVPHQPGRELLEVVPFRTALVRLERADGLHRLVIRQGSGDEKAVAFPGKAYALQILPNQDYGASAVRVAYQAPDTPRQWIDVSLATGALDVVGRDHVAGFSASDYVVERLFAPAPDGEMVPVTLLSRADAPRDGSQPLLLYGYGAYGLSSEPEFSIPATVLVDSGWRYAIAHVRGGSERGRRWFLNGRKFSKRNSFVDFIACVRHLSRERYTTEGRIVAFGLSAGGLLVGASMNMAPQTWAGVIAKVPFVDMLNTMSDAEHPLVPLFRPDWGDPLADPRAYDYIASISPYENVRSAAYPPLLCTAGLKDDRVAYWEPAKLVAEVRHRSTSGNPAILLLNADAGHQGSDNLREEYSELALFWAFAEKCIAARCSPKAKGERG